MNFNIKLIIYIFIPKYAILIILSLYKSGDLLGEFFIING